MNKTVLHSESVTLSGPLFGIPRSTKSGTVSLP
jgi:hypothetical protein